VPEAPPVSGISELVLEVSDLDAARHFYRDLLGFEETLYGEGRDDRLWYLIGSSARLPSEALDPLLERLRAAGVEVEGPIQLGADRAIYITDPDGNVVEFWTQDMAQYSAGARAGGEAGTFRRLQ